MSSATMEKKETPNRKNGAEASKEIVDVSSTPQEVRDQALGHIMLIAVYKRANSKEHR